jgi:hypothetical protein
MILRSRLHAALLATAAFAATHAAADVYVTPKHLVILREGLDAVYGNYVFAVQNTDQEPATLKATVMLPKETVDFVPQEGIEASEVSLAPGGGLLIDKSFPAGIHIVSIGFKVDAHYGGAKLTLTPTSDIQSFTLLVPRETSLTVASPVLTDGDATNAPDPQYRPLVSKEPLVAGTAFEIAVSGMPEGRARLWIAGAVIAVLLVASAGFLALKTRPRITEGDGGQVMVG